MLLQHICIASDGEKSESEFGSPKKHKIALETGEMICGYENLEDFKNEQVTRLLADRLDILCNLMNLYNRGEFKGLNYYKDRLDINDILLTNNATDNDLEKIFGRAYNREHININHIIQVATYLETRISKEQDEEGKLRNLIIGCEELQKEKENIDVYRDEPEPVSASEKRSPAIPVP